VCFWAFLDFKKQIKVQKCVPHCQCGPVVSISYSNYLLNIVTCTTGGNNHTSKCFDPLPSLEEYILHTMNCSLIETLTNFINDINFIVKHLLELKKVPLQVIMMLQLGGAKELDIGHQYLFLDSATAMKLFLKKISLSMESFSLHQSNCIS
jgi:hypothetical protein